MRRHKPRTLYDAFMDFYTHRDHSYKCACLRGNECNCFIGKQIKAFLGPLSSLTSDVTRVDWTLDDGP